MIFPPDHIAAAAEWLAAGDVVGMPTETVYGLAADATNPEAVAKIFATKGRPADHPLIVHVATGSDVSPWVTDVPEIAQQLMSAFWPGPLTLVLNKSAAIPTCVTGGQDTVALRSPAHPVAQALLKRFTATGSGIVAAPSANRFGRVSPTTAQHVDDEFAGAVPVLDGGTCAIGIESTIVDVTNPRALRILRLGQISAAAISQVVNAPVDAPDASQQAARAAAPRVSGNLAAHYAPATRLQIASPELFSDLVRQAASQSRLIAAYGFHSVQDRPDNVHFVRARIDASDYGHDLYATLRTLDRLNADVMIVEAPPQTRDWAAIRDRLTRAQAGSGNDS